MGAVFFLESLREAPVGRVYLVRHGETGWNAEGRFAGRIDAPLNDAGIAQADALAGRLLHPPTAVYSSPLRRAAQTAEAVAAAHGLRVHSKDGLRDMGFGDWEGKTFDEIAESTPGALERWRRSPHTTRVPGGETLDEVRARAWPAFEEVLAATGLEETALIVSHNAICRVLVLGTLGVPLSAFRRLLQSNAAVNEFDIGPSGALRVAAVNEACSPETRRAAA
jgi:broad specificity phosphatase PhoE